MADPTVAQDPGELFDVVRFDGTPTGVTKRRADVHRDGDWHRAVHVWVTGVDDLGPFLTFQRRSPLKDTNPGKLDATVGGHYGAGEGLDEALREVEEEIGVRVSRGSLRYAGTRVCVHETDAGLRDRELQDVFLLRDDRPLTGYRPHPAELAALVRCPLLPLLDILAGEPGTVPARSIRPGSSQVQDDVVNLDDMIVRLDRYVYRVGIAAERLLAGERHIAV